MFRKIINNIDKIDEVLKSFNNNYNGRSLNDLYRITSEEFTKARWKIQGYNIIKEYLIKNNGNENDLLEFSDIFIITIYNIIIF